MSFSFENAEYSAAAPPVTDTLADSVLILLCLTVVQRLIGFVRAVLFGRWLTPEQLGEWDMVFSFLTLAAPLAVLAIPGVFGRYVDHYRQRGQLHAFMRRTGLSCSAIALVAVGVVLVARQWFSQLIFGSADHVDMIVLSAAALLVVVVMNYFVELFTALRNIRLISVLQLVHGVAFSVFGVGLLLGWRCDARSVVVAYGSSCVVAILWAVQPFWRTWRATPPAGERMPHGVLWSHIGPYAAWILLFSVLTNLFTMVDRPMIIHFADMPVAMALDVVGNYHSARMVPMLLVSIAAMLEVMMMPHLSRDWEAGRRDLVASRLRLFLKLLGFAFVAAGAVVLLAAPLLFEVALQGKFPSGEAVLGWTLIFCIWCGLSLVAQNYLLCAEKAGLVCVAMAFGLAANVALNLVLLPRFGLEGVVLAATVANALLLWLTCRYNRRLGFHLDTGVRVAFVLPILLYLGPWVTILALVATAIAAIWGKRLLTPEEKQQLAEGIVAYWKRLGRKITCLRGGRGEA